MENVWLPLTSKGIFLLVNYVQTGRLCFVSRKERGISEVRSENFTQSCKENTENHRKKNIVLGWIQYKNLSERNSIQ